MTAYQRLEKLFRRLSHLEHVQAITMWDEAVMMPLGGTDQRASAMAEISVIKNELLRSPILAEVIAQAEGQMQLLSAWQRANLAEAKRRWLQATAVDPDLVEAKTGAGIRSEQAWRQLRPKNAWEEFRPHLEKVVALAREEAQQRALATGLPLYDSMMDMYEPGLRSTTVDRVFAELRSFLPELIDQVIERQKSEKWVVEKRTFAVDSQKKLVPEFMKWLGFDFNHGRLDESHHPFCGGVSRDVRLTTRYSSDEFLMGLMGVLHETGHAMYEQGLPVDWVEQPVGLARGMAIHESQSLFVEMQVGRSREFYWHAAPILHKHLGQAGDEPEYWSAENLYRIATRVKKSYIRVDADEVTYPAHIILRYEIEKKLIEGEIEVADLPDVWNGKMREYLNLSTEGNFKDGCMQDVHWPAGLFGYFPSYTLGAITAAQLFAALQRQIPNVREQIAKGEISPTMQWLKKNIWSQGSHYSTEELLERATGDRLSVIPFHNHLRGRYLGD